MNNLIILLGQRVRSGTNFVGTTLAQHPDLITIPRKMSLGEFNLFPDDSTLLREFENVAQKSFGMHFKPDDRLRFLKNYGEAWLKTIVEKYQAESGETIFVKSPYIHNFHLWQHAFPDSKIAVIYRDGRDNVISSVKASNDKRTGHNLMTRINKYINYYPGRSFINHARHWSQTAKSILSLKESAHLKRIKYEELVGSKENITELLKFYELRVDDAIIEKCLNAPVVGSSFGNTNDGTEKPKWKPDYNKAEYKFSGKWLRWNPVKKFTYKFI